MFIGGVLIDTTSINAARINSPGYIQFLKNELEEKNEDILEAATDEPEYYVDNVPSRMNSIHKDYYNKYLPEN